MNTPRIQFSWADAWILLSFICASRESGRAALRDIIAVADGIQHAVLNYGAADEGLALAASSRKAMGGPVEGAAAGRPTAGDGAAEREI